MDLKDKRQKVINCILIFVFIIILFIIAFATVSFIEISKRRKENNVNYSQKNNSNIEEFQKNKKEDERIRVIIDRKLKDDDIHKENNKTKYYIKINNQANVVTIYTKDSKGDYNVPIKAMICSIGDATPEMGIYEISDKYDWRFLQGDVYGQYAVRITGHILFHSVPYKNQSKDSLEWWEFDKLGTKASLGCIRLQVEDAKWIYDNCEKGTQVEFYSNENPGPLGKTEVEKISDFEDNLKCWDPTDPDENNPWKMYKENLQNIKSTNNSNEK